jgi:methionyl-tRNA synthetase
MPMISFDDFKKLELKIARIKEAAEHPNADKLLLLKLDIDGEERRVVAGIKRSYRPEDLIGKKVVAVTNLQPATIRGEESQGMILAASNEETLTLLTPDKDIAAGSKVS